MKFTPGPWASTVHRYRWDAAGHRGDRHPLFSPLADWIPLCNRYAKRQYDIQSSFKDFVILPSRSADPQDPHPESSRQ